MTLHTLRKLLTENGGSVTFKVLGVDFMFSFYKASYVNKPLLLINGWPQSRTNAYGYRFTNFITKFIKDYEIKRQLTYLFYLDSSYTFDYRTVQIDAEIISDCADLILISNFETE